VLTSKFVATHYNAAVTSARRNGDIPADVGNGGRIP